MVPKTGINPEYLLQNTIALCVSKQESKKIQNRNLNIPFEVFDSDFSFTYMMNYLDGQSIRIGV